MKVSGEEYAKMAAPSKSRSPSTRANVTQYCQAYADHGVCKHDKENGKCRFPHLSYRQIVERQLRVDTRSRAVLGIVLPAAQEVMAVPRVGIARAVARRNKTIRKD